MTWMGNTVFYDATNPDVRKFVWEKCRENYYKLRIRIFWLDEAEPEFGPYDFDITRYYLGPALQCSNIYPAMYAKGFYDGLKESGEKEIMSLVRCVWAGSQKYGVMTWPGDIHSSFRAMREQLQAGLRFYDFPADLKAWEIEDAYMFGPDVLVAPVMELHAEKRNVYLPEGASWTDAISGNVYEGGQTIMVDAPLDVIPVFVKNGRNIRIFQDIPEEECI